MAATSAKQGNSLFLVAGVLFALAVVVQLLELGVFGYFGALQKLAYIINLLSYIAFAIGAFMGNRIIIGVAAAAQFLRVLIIFIYCITEHILDLLGWMTWVSMLLQVALFVLLALIAFLPPASTGKALPLVTAIVAGVFALFVIIEALLAIARGYVFNYWDWYSGGEKLYYIAVYLFGWEIPLGVLFLSLGLMQGARPAQAAVPYAGAVPYTGAVPYAGASPYAGTAPMPVQTPAQTLAPTAVADELLKLHQLKEAGILTQEEFEAQKKRFI